MSAIKAKFARLGTENAPGQEGRQSSAPVASTIEEFHGKTVDFSHGDVDAFTPPPNALDAFLDGAREGGSQAYTEYRGRVSIREVVAGHLADFTGAPVSARDGVIITPGTQGALFLAMAASITAGDKVAVVQPDYFANRKLVAFLDAELIPVKLDYISNDNRAGLDLDQLEDAFKAGAKALVFSNPNNPAGVIYSPDEIATIGHLASRYGTTVIVDQLYSRLLYDGRTYTHLRATAGCPQNIITIMGPSKTESLSGYRLGVAFGTPAIIERMEKLQAIVSLRAGGYSQAVLNTWFAEPEGWMAERITLHQAIRNDLLTALRASGVPARTPEAGSYLFPRLPALSVSTQEFVLTLRERCKVVVTPGSEFGPTSSDSVRLNFSQDRKAAVAAVERLLALAGHFKP